MTSQLALPLQSTLRYLPKQFLLHAGVKSTYIGTIEAIRNSEFRICSIVGPARSGRTHLSVRLGDDLSTTHQVALLNSSSFKRLVLSTSFNFSAETLIIVDDADDFFEQLHPGESGPFVNLIESLRLQRSKIVFLLKQNPSLFRCDQHALSRLRAGLGFAIQSPEQGDLVDLLQVLARQRGFELDDRKLKFLSRRLRRDICSLEGYLDRLAHLSMVIGAPIKLSLLSTAV